MVRLSLSFTRVRIDCTLEGGAQFAVTDSSRAVMASLGAKSWPTVIALTPDGVEIDRFVGLRPSPDVRAFLSSALAAPAPAPAPAPADDDALAQAPADSPAPPVIPEVGTPTAELRDALARLDRRIAELAAEAARIRTELAQATRDGAAGRTTAEHKDADSTDLVRVAPAAHETIVAGGWSLEFGCVTETATFVRIVTGPRNVRVRAVFADGTRRALVRQAPSRDWFQLTAPEGSELPIALELERIDPT